MKTPSPTNYKTPIHPGEVLLHDFLEPLEMTAYALAKAIRVPQTRVHAIVKRERGISADTAIRLGRYFGTTPPFWLNLQASYDLKSANAKKIEREITPMAKQPA